MESGFNPNATSPTGAEGMFQFEPGTYQSYGPAGSSAYNPTDEVVAYENYMNTLLKEEGGSVFKALEAYNAGPGNLGAGSGYASSILSNAGVPASVSSGGGSVSATGSTSSNPSFSWTNPSTWLPSIIAPEENAINDILERGALIVFGAIMIIMGLIRFTSSGQRIVADTKKAAPVAAEAAVAA